MEKDKESFILADETANLALKTLATGGIYPGGGILPRILSFLGRGQFLKTFHSPFG